MCISMLEWFEKLVKLIRPPVLELGGNCIGRYLWTDKTDKIKHYLMDAVAITIAYWKVLLTFIVCFVCKLSVYHLVRLLVRQTIGMLDSIGLLWIVYLHFDLAWWTIGTWDSIGRLQMVYLNFDLACASCCSEQWNFLLWNFRNHPFVTKYQSLEGLKILYVVLFSWFLPGFHL